MHLHAHASPSLCVCAVYVQLERNHLSLCMCVDLFAIPDFSAGAMENWGLITYRETALLYDEETDPATSKQRVAVVIAHELAHQVHCTLCVCVCVCVCVAMMVD